MLHVLNHIIYMSLHDDPPILTLFWPAWGVLYRGQAYCISVLKVMVTLGMFWQLSSIGTQFYYRRTEDMLQLYNIYKKTPLSI